VTLFFLVGRHSGLPLRADDGGVPLVQAAAGKRGESAEVLAAAARRTDYLNRACRTVGCSGLALHLLDLDLTYSFVYA
jgi:hypothetical protein